jgi:hypothetical protein
MGSSDMVFRWRKSSRSGHNGACVELGRAWRKSSRSGETGQCVELASFGAVRDSKNPTGPTLTVDLTALITAVKSTKFT